MFNRTFSRYSSSECTNVVHGLSSSDLIATLHFVVEKERNWIFLKFQHLNI